MTLELAAVLFSYAMSVALPGAVRIALEAFA